MRRLVLLALLCLLSGARGSEDGASQGDTSSADNAERPALDGEQRDYLRRQFDFGGQAADELRQAVRNCREAMTGGGIPFDCQPYGDNLSFGRATSEVKDVAKHGGPKCLRGVNRVAKLGQRQDGLRERIGDLTVENLTAEGPTLADRYLDQDKASPGNLTVPGAPAASERVATQNRSVFRPHRYS